MTFLPLEDSRSRLWSRIYDIGTDSDALPDESPLFMPIPLLRRRKSAGAVQR